MIFGGLRVFAGEKVVAWDSAVSGSVVACDRENWGESLSMKWFTQITLDMVKQRAGGGQRIQRLREREFDSMRLCRRYGMSAWESSLMGKREMTTR